MTKTVYKEAKKYGFSEVFFIRDAFLRLQEGKTHSATLEFEKEEINNAHKLGGSLQGNSKPGLPKTEQHYKKIAKSLERLGVTHLLSVGGDDSAKTLFRLKTQAKWLKIVLIPKTMDDDVYLPESVKTLGVSTTVEQAAKDFRALQANARQLERQYMLVSMGRNSGRTPYAIGKAGKADLILLREFFKKETTLLDLAKIILGSRLLKEFENPFPKPFSHAVLIGENLIEFLKKGEIKKLDKLREKAKKTGKNIDLSEVPFAELLEKEVASLFKKLGKKRVVACETMNAAPRGYPANKKDKELAISLTRHALSLLKSDKGGLVVFCDDDKCREKSLSTLSNLKTGEGKTRMLGKASIREARRELSFLRESDFNPARLLFLSALTNMTADEFKAFFKPAHKDFL